ncbi:MAG: hypothetical protein HY520_03085 [Candidatus Aenigmarchaeota archaeon]|nr:hypothetical protein [Candidatus Aenigmarchaeota archaeon]
MITSPSSWEQVLYEVVAWEGLDPWDIDLQKLAAGFTAYVGKLEEMDFKVPAKYVMIAAILLRMKTDHLPLLNYFNQPPEAEPLEGEGEAIPGVEDPVINALTIPPRRIPTRKIIIADLVDALRKVMGSSERRSERMETAKQTIRLKQDDISRRIGTLYEKINSILGKMKKEEVEFSTLVPTWTRPEVANTFLPLVFLDHEQKVECRQEEVFQEIYVRRGAAANGTAKAGPVHEASHPAPQKAASPRQLLNASPDHPARNAKAAPPAAPAASPVPPGPRPSAPGPEPAPPARKQAGMSSTGLRLVALDEPPGRILRAARRMLQSAPVKKAAKHAGIKTRGRKR